MEGIFYDNVEEYNDRLEPLRHAREQYALIIERMTGCTAEEANEKAIKLIKSRFKDRPTTFFLRQENGDLRLMRSGLAGYINTHVKHRNVIAPSFSTYVSADKQVSKWADYTIRNVNKRAKDKKEAQEAKAKGDHELGDFKNTSQSNMKTKNNALSGLFISATSVVNNPTAHSTLTSMTRTMTSMTNANNERLIAGNRAYLTPRYALYGAINESRYCNKEMLAEAIKQYNLYIPTVDDIVSVLKHSSEIYSKDDHYYRKYIIPYLSKLTDVEKCGIVYSQDLYHLYIYNPELMRMIFTELTHKVTDRVEKLEDPYIINSIEQSIVYYVHSLFSEEIKGLGKDYKLMNEKGIAANIYHTCLYIKDWIKKNEVFFKAIFKNEITPINSFRMQYVRRKAVALSDTDSSGFSMDNIVKWYLGDVGNTPEAVGLSGAITYLSSENIVHQLSRFSTYMNVSKKELRRLSMKNEWYWTVFTPTNATKHYFSDAAIQEGNVFPESELEIKGVHLKSSNLPDSIISYGNDLIHEYNTGLKNNKPLTLEYIINKIIELENEIITSLYKGETKYLSSVNINGPEAYPGDTERSPYRHHLLWKRLFEDKYGVIAEPPYTTVKIPCKMHNKSALKEWVDSIKDPAFKNRLEKWLEISKRNDLNTINLPADFVEGNGIPEEIIDWVDVNKIVLAMTKQVRIVLTSLGLVLDPEELVKDQYLI